MVPGENPVMADPGQTPTFPPLISEGPVLVTVEPARTAKFAAVPRSIPALNGEEKPTNARNATRASLRFLIAKLPALVDDSKKGLARADGTVSLLLTVQN
jgi:hypothetical protein